MFVNVVGAFLVPALLALLRRLFKKPFPG